MLSKKLIVAGMLVSSVLGSLSSESFAQQKVTVLTEHLAPFQIVNGDSVTGMSTEIVEATFEKAKIPYEIQSNPWTISYHRALQESGICIYSLTRIPQRNHLFKWIGQIASTSTSFYTLAESKIEITSIDAAKAYKTAVLRDDVTHHILRSKGFVENQNMYVMDNYDALLSILERRPHIELIIINDELIYHRTKDTKRVKRYKKLFNSEELILRFYLACNLNTDSETVQKLTDSMRELESQGQFDVIRDNWKDQMLGL